MNKNIKMILLLLTGAIMTACNYNAPSESELFYADEDSVLLALTADGRIYGLQELKDSFMTEKGNYTDSTLEAFYRLRANNGDDIWYFSIDTFPTAGPGIYIVGRICTEDVGGNYYKSLVLQDINKNGEQENLRVSVDVGSIGGLYPIGQKILIRCNGLGIGKYSNQPQLCSPSYNNNIHAMNANEKVGWQPGRIPGPQFYNAVKRIGIPDPSALMIEELTMEQLQQRYIQPYSTKPIECRKYDGRLVRLKDIHYDGTYEKDSSTKPYTPTFVQLNAYRPNTAGKDSIGYPKSDQNANVLAPTTTNLNFPQARIVTDANNKYKFEISNSEFAKFSYYFLPSHITRKGQYDPAQESALDFDYAACVGSVTGILGYYVDKASTMTSDYDAVKPFNWSITPCNLNDFDFIDTKTGEKWIPVEFSKALFNVEN